MFEKPKSLSELAEYEFQQLVGSLICEWDGSGPNPGYSWEEFFSDADFGEVPEWFNEWLPHFEVEELVSIEDESLPSISLCLLKDTQRNEDTIFSATQCDPAQRVGEPSYFIDAITPELLLPFVEEFLKQDESSKMKIKVWNQALVQTKIGP